MKHGDKVKKLSRNTSHRKALLRNLATALLQYEAITTTIQKAKAVKPFVEKLITKGKVDNLSNRRLVAESLYKPEIVQKLFDDVAKRYENRPGGYTRIIRLGFRKTDASEMAILELVEEKLEKKSDK